MPVAERQPEAGSWPGSMLPGRGDERLSNLLPRCLRRGHGRRTGGSPVYPVASGPCRSSHAPEGRHFQRRAAVVTATDGYEIYIKSVRPRAAINGARRIGRLRGNRTFHFPVAQSSVQCREPLADHPGHEKARPSPHVESRTTRRILRAWQIKNSLRARSMSRPPRG